MWKRNRGLMVGNFDVMQRALCCDRAAPEGFAECSLGKKESVLSFSWHLKEKMTVVEVEVVVEVVVVVV